MTHKTEFVERQLTEIERETTAWLLGHGNPESAAFASQLAEATVIGVCGCGCASVNFAIRGRVPEPAGLQILSDYYWIDGHKHTGGIFAFAISGQLAGLEVYSMDGECDVSRLPDLALLTPLPKNENGGCHTSH